MVRRRLLLVLTALLVAAGVASALVVAVGRDDGGDVEARRAGGEATSTTASAGSDVGPGPQTPTSPATVTPPEGGAVGVRGATPASGALLAHDLAGDPVAIGDPPACPGLGDDFDVEECQAASGSGGRFVVAVGSQPDGARQARLYAAAGDGRFAPVAASEAFERDIDVFGITLRPGEVGGEPVVVVDYDFNGSGSVHSFDVVAWDEGTDAPTVVAFVEGAGMDRVTSGDGTLQFVSANYDDGSPTCCPQQADVRTLRRDRAASWRLETETVPISEAP